MTKLKKIFAIRSIVGMLLSIAISTQVQAYGMLATGYSSSSFSNTSTYEEDYDEENLPPTAVIKVRNDSGNKDQYSGTTKTVFIFDGGSSRDYETPSSLLEVRFDFENDGKVDTYFSITKFEKHTFDTPGLKTVRMEVLDREGNVSEAFTYINVVENTAPEAHFTVEPKIGTPGTQFQFNAKLSNDSQYNENLLKYRWDFDGNGKFDTKYSSNELLKHQFDTPGLRKVILEVRDPEGLSAYYYQMIMVKENTPSIASFTITQRDNDETKAIMKMDASDSYDPDGGRLKYRWDFNYTGKNDIQFSTSWYNSSQAYAHFYKSGEYLVKLLTKDQDNAITTTFGKIHINLVTE
ncbi:PKD domain-containing protein [Patescibacteria group bacterium]|nr:PKD domain-containing protein [Patescibacteria group bacterium]